VPEKEDCTMTETLGRAKLLQGTVYPILRGWDFNDLGSRLIAHVGVGSMFSDILVAEFNAFAEDVTDAVLKALTREPSEADVERVARAICARQVDYCGPHDNRTLAERIEEEWGVWLPEARAAIAALALGDAKPSPPE